MMMYYDGLKTSLILEGEKNQTNQLQHYSDEHINT